MIVIYNYIITQNWQEKYHIYITLTYIAVWRGLYATYSYHLWREPGNSIDLGWIFDSLGGAGAAASPALPQNGTKIESSPQRSGYKNILGGGNSNIFYFHPYLGKSSNWTNIFEMGWNHQLVLKHNQKTASSVFPGRAQGWGQPFRSATGGSFWKTLARFLAYFGDRYQGD